MALLMIGLFSFTSKASHKSLVARLLVIFFLWLQLGGLWTLLTSYYSTSSLPTLVNQVSQYKPIFAKGNVWYLYTMLYFTSIYAIVSRTTTKSE